MTRTPDDVKKGLEYISIKDVARKLDAWEDGIPYDYVEDAAADALALIQQLEADNAQLNRCIENMTDKMNAMNEEAAQLKAERDDLKEALGLMVYQYCVRGDKLDHLYMCAGETAFRVLGLEQYGNASSLESWLFPEYQGEEE